MNIRFIFFNSVDSIPTTTGIVHFSIGLLMFVIHAGPTMIQLDFVAMTVGIAVFFSELLIVSSQ